MVQEKIGNFIKEVRKEKGLTQEELAAKISVTSKTISKWECGRGIPDASLMLPLCDALSISATELLLGEHVKKEKYMEKSDEVILELRKSNEKKGHILLMAEIFLLIVCTIICCLLCAIADTVNMPTYAKALLICGGLFLIFLGIFISIFIESKVIVGFECPECGEVVKSNLRIILFNLHLCWKRSIKCPNCKKRHFMKKMIG